ncbi:hypothetical protein G6F32_010375 [Rhizopus arrhizus]|nr:hypothetical protein G6F32_010375 [Rhizopus arrhizus]
MKKEWLTMFMLLVPIMIFMWLVSGLFIWWLVPPINYLHALVIAACVCPTDPILANSVVKGRFAEKHVPAHIRNALSAESGANDGMGFPFLFLALFLISEENVGTAIGKWIYMTCLFQIALSCVIGLVVGYIARIILQWSEKNHLIDKPSFLCFAIALALFLMSMTGFSGSDDLLACFVAGNAFSWDDWFRQETEEAHFQEVIDMMLNLAVFVYIGAIIPWSDFGNAALGLAPWRLVVIAILILVFRRLPILIILKPVMPAMKTYREAIFSGWFGPMGVGAVFLSMVAKEELIEIYHDSETKPVAIDLVSPVVLFIVLSSTLVHGTTIPLFKIGKRIRTRTLSIASTGSGQVLRLPKLQFGQQISFGRKSEENIQQQVDNMDAMSQLKRNTYLNTMQPQQQQPQTVVQIQEDEDNLPEEDFLPDESDSTEIGTDSGKIGDKRTTAAQEPQSIRFLEPVNPRGSASHNASATQVASNIEKNEASVSSLKSWINRNKAADHAVQTEESATTGGGGGGLRNLFRRHKESETRKEEAELPTERGNNNALNILQDLFANYDYKGKDKLDVGIDHLDPAIEVWNEANHVVIENKNDAASQVVIDKSDPDWLYKVKEKVRELQFSLDDEDEKKSI